MPLSRNTPSNKHRPLTCRVSFFVGAGLPAITVCQLMHLLLTQRYRRQASSHI